MSSFCLSKHTHKVAYSFQRHPFIFSCQIINIAMDVATDHITLPLGRDNLISIHLRGNPIYQQVWIAHVEASKLLCKEVRGDHFFNKQYDEYIILTSTKNSEQRYTQCIQRALKDKRKTPPLTELNQSTKSIKDFESSSMYNLSHQTIVLRKRLLKT